MNVLATTFDGQPLGQIDLVRAHDGRVTVNGLPVLATRPIGSRIDLVVGARQYCVLTTDYWSVMRTARGERSPVS